MALTMILTGDVNLMKVADPEVPFRRVGEELRKADVVFGNLECCLTIPAAHSHGNEGFFADPAVGGAALRRGGIQAVGIANNVHYGDANIMASIARLDELAIPHTRVGARAGDPRARRPALRLPAAQLGLLADQPRGACGRAGHRGDPRAYGLSGARVQDAARDPAAQPAWRATRDRHLGGRRLPAR